MLHKSKRVVKEKTKLLKDTILCKRALPCSFSCLLMDVFLHWFIPVALYFKSNSSTLRQFCSLVSFGVAWCTEWIFAFHFWDAYQWSIIQSLTSICLLGWGDREKKDLRRKKSFPILLKSFLHRYIWISWEWEVRHMNANHTVKVMKHLGNFANLDFHECLGQNSQISSVNFCQWKIATCRFHLETRNQIWLCRFSSETKGASIYAS